MKLLMKIRRLINAYRFSRLKTENVFVGRSAIKVYEKSLLDALGKVATSSGISQFNYLGRTRETLEFTVEGDKAIWLLPVDGLTSELIVESPELQKKLVSLINRKILLAAFRL